MATAYVADRYTDEVRVLSTAGDFTQPFLYTLTAAFVVLDTIKLAAIPVGVNVLEWYLDVPDLDTSTGFACQLGDGTTAALFMAANTVGQAAGIVYSQKDGAAGILPRGFTTSGFNFTLTVSTAATGTAATTGVIKGAIRYQKIGIAAGV